MKYVALIVAGVATLGPSALAAGVDTRTYTCAGLQALIATNRFVFINTPGFGDFAVADRSSCTASDIIQRRSVATTDTPECIVNYCKPPSESRGAE